MKRKNQNKCYRAVTSIYTYVNVYQIFSSSPTSQTYSSAHRPGSFGRRRPLSVCDGAGVTNIYLKPHNRPIFEKNTVMAYLGPSCAPLGQNGDQKGQSLAAPFCEKIVKEMAIRE